jgi:hypothetical protein
MTYAKVRLTITLYESSLLTPGLDALNTGLATAAQGDFPDFYAEALGYYGRNIHPNRRFDLEMAGRIPGVHEQLSTITSSRKVRLDLFDIATVQFALRLFRTNSGRPHDPTAIRSLDLKLEKYRKRAKRKAENTRGKASIAEASATWRAFISWCRVNLLHFRLSACAFAFPRRGLWAQQSSSTADMIRLALEERCFAALDETQMKRVVRLVKEKFHRVRHPLTLRELLTGECTSGRALLFKLVARKMELTALPGAKLSVSIAASERGERFKAATAARRETSDPRYESVADRDPMQVDSSVYAKADSQRINCPVNAKPEIQIPAREIVLTTAITDWLREHVDPKLWQPVTEQVRFALQNSLDWGRNVPIYDGISDLITKSRPPEETYDWTGGVGHINHPAVWLFTWITKLEPNPAKAYSAVLYGYGNALKVQKDMHYN